MQVFAVVFAIVTQPQLKGMIYRKSSCVFISSRAGGGTRNQPKTRQSIDQTRNDVEHSPTGNS